MSAVEPMIEKYNKENKDNIEVEIVLKTGDWELPLKPQYYLVKHLTFSTALEVKMKLQATVGSNLGMIIYLPVSKLKSIHIHMLSG